MQDEILQRLDALAAKLGVAGEGLWEILVLQAKISGIVDLIWVPILALLAFGAIRLMKWAEDQASDWDGVMVLSCVVIFASTIALPFLFTAGIKELLNPEYYALNKILTILGK